MKFMLILFLLGSLSQMANGEEICFSLEESKKLLQDVRDKKACREEITILEKLDKIRDLEVGVYKEQSKSLLNLNSELRTQLKGVMFVPWYKEPYIVAAIGITVGVILGVGIGNGISK